MKSFKSKLCFNQVLAIALISFLYMVLSDGLFAQNVAITDDDGYTVNSSAMLDVKSVNKGLLVPRVALVSTTDPVSVTKPEGLLVWNTSLSGSYPDPGFYYWSGSNWIKVGTSALDFQHGLIKTGNTVSHEDLSSQSSINNSNGTVIQDVTLGSLGHITGLVSYNLDNRYYAETEVDKLISEENFWDRTSTITYLHNSGDKVGIGLSNPPMKLSVLGNGLFTDDIYLRDGTITGDNLVRIYDSSDDGVLDIYQNNAVKIRLHGNSNSYFTGGNVGFGTTTPGSRLEVYGNETGSDNDPLFEVKNNTGQTIFAVYPEGVRIYVDEDVSKGLKGGFAVGGFNSSKGITNEYLRITPDTFRIYVDDTGTKGLKGGFAVGGFGPSKGLTNEYFRITPDSVRIYVDNEPGTKGLKGGFAVGGFNSSKGYEEAISFMDLTPENYLIGHESGQKITNGEYNTFFGFEAGYSTEGGVEISPGQWQGCNNIFIGYQSGYDNITGYKNVFMGYKSGANNTSGEKNIFIGNASGEYNTTGGYNSFIGYNAGIVNSSGMANTFLGSNCGFYNSTGGFNTCLGSHTGEYLDASGYNTFIGTYSGHGGGFPGSYPSAKITGNYNTFLGYRSGFDNLSGSKNTYLGYKSGHENASGSGNVFIGSEAGYNEPGSNKLYIDNTNTTTPLIWGDFSTDKLRFNANVGMGIAASTTSRLYVRRDAASSTSNSYAGLFQSFGGSTSGNAYGARSYSYAYGSSTSYAIYANADGGSTTGHEYAFYGNGEGYFSGNVVVNGTLSKGGGSFKIDHPLDPKNKFLYHSFVESPDMMNIYNGNIILDGTGEAYVAMPDWFEALNMEFRYQLTAIGAPGPNLYIAEEVSGNSFKIAGGTSGMKVSWQVTGIRHDKFAEKNPINVEVDKNSEEKGLYLHPDAFSQPEEKGIDYKINNEI